MMDTFSGADKPGSRMAISALQAVSSQPAKIADGILGVFTGSTMASRPPSMPEPASSTGSGGDGADGESGQRGAVLDSHARGVGSGLAAPLGGGWRGRWAWADRARPAPKSRRTGRLGHAVRSARSAQDV